MRFCHFLQKRYQPTDGPTDRRTDGWTHPHIEIRGRMAWRISDDHLQKSAEIPTKTTDKRPYLKLPHTVLLTAQPILLIEN